LNRITLPFNVAIFSTDLKYEWIICFIVTPINNKHGETMTLINVEPLRRPRCHWNSIRPVVLRACLSARVAFNTIEKIVIYGKVVNTFLMKGNYLTMNGIFKYK